MEPADASTIRYVVGTAGANGNTSLLGVYIETVSRLCYLITTQPQAASPSRNLV